MSRRSARPQFPLPVNTRQTWTHLAACQRWWRSARATLGLAVVLAPSSVHGQDVLQRIAVSLNSGAFGAQLPFDEPFLIVGKVAADLDSLRAYYGRGITFDAGCVPTEPRQQSTSGHGATAPDSAKRDSTKQQATNSAQHGLLRPDTTNLWDRSKQPQADSFNLRVPRLSANRIYTFCFRSTSHLPTDSISAFRTKVAAHVDRALRSIYAANPQGPPANDAVLDSIHLAIVNAARDGRQSVVISPKSILQPDVFRAARSHPPPQSSPSQGDATKGFVKALSDFLTLAVQRENNRKDVEEKATRLATALRAVAGERSALDAVARDSTSVARDPSGSPGVLDSLLSASYAVGRRDTALRSGLAPAIATGIALSALVGNEAVAKDVGGGQSALSPDALRAVPMPVLLNDVYDPAAVDPRLDNLTKTQSSLLDFRTLTVRAEVDPLFHQSGGPSAVSLRRLRRQTDNALAYLSSMENYVLSFKHSLDQRRHALNTLAEDVTPIVQTDVALVGTSIGTFETRAKWFVTADIGIAYSGAVQEVVPYFGANFYFRPINKRVPLGRCWCLKQRAALMVGLTASSIEKTGERDDLFGSHSALVGLGFRVTDFARLSGGALIYKALSADPFVDRSGLRAQPFGSVSLDWDVKGTLGKIADILSQ